MSIQPSIPNTLEAKAEIVVALHKLAALNSLEQLSSSATEDMLDIGDEDNANVFYMPSLRTIWGLRLELVEDVEGHFKRLQGFLQRVDAATPEYQ